MKVIAVNGSPHKNGNTYESLAIVSGELEKQGIETEIVHIGNKVIRGCTGCNYCQKNEENNCVFNDDAVNETASKMAEADGIILGSPVYYSGIAGTMKSFLDRVFFSKSEYFRYKVCTAVVAVRRSGGVDTFHQLNNYFNLGEMIIVPSHYWSVIHGRRPGEVLQDEEGVQTLREAGKSMVWLMKSLDHAKNAVEKPEKEERKWTHFIR